MSSQTIKLVEFAQIIQSARTLAVILGAILNN